MISVGRFLATGATILILAAAGCSRPAPSSQAPAKAAPTVAASGAAPSSRSSSRADSNARLLVDALASGNSATIRAARNSVAGPVMIRYIAFQVVEAAAAEASGQPEAAGSVSAAGGGSYRLCLPHGQGCQSFSAFHNDAAGHITGMSVDGQPIAARLAAGPSASGNGLRLSDVSSYLFTSTGQVGVAFRVRNTGNQRVSALGFQTVFVTSPGDERLNPDLGSSSMTSTQPLRPGESAAVVAVFDTRSFTGTFILQSNGGYQLLVSARLRKPAA